MVSSERAQRITVFLDEGVVVIARTKALLEQPSLVAGASSGMGNSKYDEGGVVSDARKGALGEVYLNPLLPET